MADIEKVELRLRMDATVSIHNAVGNVDHWIKPGVEVASWFNGMPTTEEIELAYQNLSHITSAVLETQVFLTHQEIVKQHQGK